MNLNGKTIMVTGAGQGLGQKMAEMIAARGANLALVDVSEEQLQESVQLCRDAGGEARPYAADVADEASVEDLFNNVVNDFGSLDGLVNNAGINRDALLVKAKNGQVESKMSLEDWQAVIQVDLRGVFLCGREGAARMIELGKPGVIINISSIAREGNIGQTNYAAAKAGVVGMTLTWAQELGRYGIRVAAIAPGFCNTRMVANMSEKVLEKLKSRVPLKRLGEPSEIGHSAIYILENDYFNGRVLEVDGGLRL